MADVSKIQLPSGTTYTIKDTRIPVTTSSDEGKSIFVNSNGQLIVDDLPIYDGTVEGGGLNTWSLLKTEDCSENHGSITISNLSNYTQFMIYAELVYNASSTNSGYTLTINSTDIAQGFVKIPKTGTNQYHWSYAWYDGMFWHVEVHQPTINNDYIAVAAGQVAYFFKQNVGMATTFKLSAPVSTYQATSGTIKIWGR